MGRGHLARRDSRARGARRRARRRLRDHARRARSRGGRGAGSTRRALHARLSTWGQRPSHTYVCGANRFVEAVTQGARPRRHSGAHDPRGALRRGVVGRRHREAPALSRNLTVGGAPGWPVAKTFADRTTCETKTWTVRFLLTVAGLAKKRMHAGPGAASTTKSLGDDDEQQARSRCPVHRCARRLAGRRCGPGGPLQLAFRPDRRSDLLGRRHVLRGRRVPSPAAASCRVRRATPSCSARRWTSR